MHRVVLAIFVIVLLGVTIDGLGSQRFKSSLSNGQKRTDKRRNKRQSSDDPDAASMSQDTPSDSPGNSDATDGLYNGSPRNQFGGGSSPCSLPAPGACDAYADNLRRSANSMSSLISFTHQQSLYTSGVVSLSGLQTGGMCYPSTNLFTSNTFAAIALGHMTLAQLAVLRLFPVPSINLNMLINAGYFKPTGSYNFLSGLGIQASLIGHILPSQLQSLNAYPLQGPSLSYDSLVQVKYITKECLPTALGLAAIHINYLSKSSLNSLDDCSSSNNDQYTLAQYSSAKYFYGPLYILTTVGFAAMRSGYASADSFKSLGVYPFSGGFQTQSTDDTDQGQRQSKISSIIMSLIHTGYIHERTGLLTNAAYFAMTEKYFTIDDFRYLNIWPYPGTPTMDAFVSAGYASYSGHLTNLGYSLLRDKYFPDSWLAKLGIVTHDDYHLFSHALHFTGYVQSTYHNTHVTVHGRSTFRSGAAANTNGSGIGDDTNSATTDATK